jgi:hypothetical protein
MPSAWGMSDPGGGALGSEGRPLLRTIISWAVPIAPGPFDPEQAVRLAAPRMAVPSKRMDFEKRIMMAAPSTGR